jgi:hypothetical protein
MAHSQPPGYLTVLAPWRAVVPPAEQERAPEMRLRRLVEVLMIVTLAGGLTACSELLAAGAGAGAGYVVGSEVEEAEHEDE